MHDPSRKPRSDGLEARAHLLQTALRLFSENGFAKTSTRQIAQAAGVNIASISYYFGDKAGLYRAAFLEPMVCASDAEALVSRDDWTLRESLSAFFAHFVAPMKDDGQMQLCTRLHMREMLEPTGVWAEEIENGIKPAHAALVAMLCRHLGVTEADDDVHRLAFSVVSLGLQMFFCADVVQAIAPRLMAGPVAIDLWATRLAEYAEAMVVMEASRRQPAADRPAPPRQQKGSI